MCGIVGYIGSKNCVPVLINGLKRLEYRGYDSAGIAVLDGTKPSFVKNKGKINILDEQTEKAQLKGTIGIGHTRCCLLYTSRCV